VRSGTTDQESKTGTQIPVKGGLLIFNSKTRDFKPLLRATLQILPWSNPGLFISV